MRRLWAAALTPVLGLAFLVMGSGPANAFGSEVLGCAFQGSTWTASSCAGYDSATFSVHNLSGTYSYAWTFTIGGLNWAPKSCGSSSPCVQSGCTTTSSTCTVNDWPLHDQTITATVRLTQSGQSRTIQASALYYSDPPCLTC
jgi:hypothetical protein